MLYWKRVIRGTCLFLCLIPVLYTFYEICAFQHQFQMVRQESVKNSIEGNKRAGRVHGGYSRLRQYQLIAKQEINRRRFYNLINTSQQLPYREYKDSECKTDDSQLVGHVTIESDLTCDEVNAYLQTEHLDVQNGGHWQPTICSRHSLGIVIPYRDRLQHLCVLLRYIIPMLKRQQIEFRIILAEQAGNNTFNKGKLMNAAFIESTKLFNFQCVIFHDVDLIPENDRNIYQCPWQPTHLSVAIDEMNYRLQYEMLVGGVLAMRTDQFISVNGYSNQFWGWGGEDDDMAYRILLSGLRILRPPSNIAKYKMLRHKKQVPAAWKSRIKLLSSVNRRFLDDGLNSAKYVIKSRTKHRFFIHYLIDVGEPPP